MNMEQLLQTKQGILAEIKRAKKTLYVEEVKSALFAAAFAANLAVIIVHPFTLITLVNVVLAMYMFGFFKPTIKKQEYLHTVIRGLRDMLTKVDNPPRPQKPTSPWKT